MAGFNVRDFRTVMEANAGLLQNSKFLVQIPVPKGLEGIISPNAGNSYTDIMSFYCKATSLPGIGLFTTNYKRYGYGPSILSPHQAVFNDIMMQFYVDGGNRIRSWFRNWLRLIGNPDSRNGILSTSGINNAKSYEFEFREQYVSDIVITVFTPEGKPSIQVKLMEAYPNFVGDAMVDWDDRNTKMILPISMTYRDWYEASVPDVTARPSGIVEFVPDGEEGQETTPQQQVQNTINGAFDTVLNSIGPGSGNNNNRIDIGELINNNPPPAEGTPPDSTPPPDQGRW